MSEKPTPKGFVGGKREIKHLILDSLGQKKRSVRESVLPFLGIFGYEIKDV